MDQTAEDGWSSNSSTRFTWTSSALSRALGAVSASLGDDISDVGVDLVCLDHRWVLICVLVISADVRTAPRTARLTRLRYLCPSVRHLWADSGYTGTLIDWARSLFGMTIEIVTKLAGQVGYVVLHRRWVVERSFAWIDQHRRCVRDCRAQATSRPVRDRVSHR